jgi:putative inorganic carbon (hco3(-)) transporter
LERVKNAASVLVAAGVFAHAFFCPISIAATQIGLGIAAAGLVCAALAGWRPRRSPLDVPLVALVAVAIASDALSPYGPPTAAFATLWRSALGFWIVFQAVSFAPRHAIRLVLFAAAGVAISSAVGLLQYRTGIDLVHRLGLREQPAWVEAPGAAGRYGAMGFFTSRLTFGHNATVLLAWIGGALATGGIPVRLRGAVLVSAALAFGAILTTFDRAAWLGLALAALVIAAAQRRSGRALLAGLALGAAAFLVIPQVRTRFTTSFDVASNADRVFIWSRALEIVRDHPVLGIGFGNYPRVCGEYYDRVDPGFPMRTWAHNTELSMLAETGPLGLAALIWVAAAAFHALRTRIRDGYGLAVGGAAAVAALAVIGQAHDVLYDTKVMYALWLALGTAFAPRAPASHARGPSDAAASIPSP